MNNIAVEMNNLSLNYDNKFSLALLLSITLKHDLLAVFDRKF